MGRHETLDEPQTEQARRTLRLGAEVRAALRSQRKRQLGERISAGAQWVERDFVFTSPTRRPLDTSNVTHRLQAHLVKAGLPRQRFHDLRHACATLLLEQGEEMRVISKILGHSTLATTADIYAHLTPGMSQRAAERLDSVLGPRSATGA